MIKVFCDKCDKIIKDTCLGRVKRKIGRYEIEILTAIDDTWNAGALCESCVLDIVKNGKPSK